MSHTLRLFMPPILRVRVGGARLSHGRPHKCFAIAQSMALSQPLRYFCPASLPVSLSNLLAHCDSSMAAIFGAPWTRSSTDKPCMPCSSCPRNLICTFLKVSLCLFAHVISGGVVCCCGRATRLRSKRPVSFVSLPLADRKCACRVRGIRWSPTRLRALSMIAASSTSPASNP